MPITSETLEFLMENRLQDSRAWFSEHKSRYRELVLKPMQELVAALSPGMLEIDPDLITQPSINRTISQLHRDTRFSKDKSLYRDNCWLVFMRQKKLYDGLPAFYLDISPRGFSYGMGYYQASSASMTAARELILGRELVFLTALSAYEGQSLFVMEGEMYKRSRYADQPEPYLSWLMRKNFSFNRHSKDLELLFSDRLAGELLEGYRLLAPVYRFLLAAEARRPHPEASDTQHKEGGAS